MPWLAENRDRLNGFRRGDEKTLAEVYRVYAPRLAGRLNRRLRLQVGNMDVVFVGAGMPFDVHDIMQETFLRAFREPARLNYDGLRPYLNYLETVGRNLLIDWYRQGERRTHLFSEHVTTEVEPEVESPEQIAMGRQLQQLYEGFVKTLSEDDRLLVRLRFEKGAPRRAVAEQTGYSAMTVRTREADLRRQLHQLLRARVSAGGGAS